MKTLAKSIQLIFQCQILSTQSWFDVGLFYLSNVKYTSDAYCFGKTQLIRANGEGERTNKLFLF